MASFTASYVFPAVEIGVVKPRLKLQQVWPSTNCRCSGRMALATPQASLGNTPISLMLRPCRCGGCAQFGPQGPVLIVHFCRCGGFDAVMSIMAGSAQRLLPGEHRCGAVCGCGRPVVAVLTPCDMSFWHC